MPQLLMKLESIKSKLKERHSMLILPSPIQAHLSLLNPCLATNSNTRDRVSCMRQNIGLPTHKYWITNSKTRVRVSCMRQNIGLPTAEILTLDLESNKNNGLI